MRRPKDRLRPSRPATPSSTPRPPLFSARGFDGVSMDDIARDAGVNKAMIYYHFADKLALYRAVVGDGLETMGEIVDGIAASAVTPASQARSLHRGVRAHDGDAPWMPAMMLREIAEGAPRLDPDTMAHMRGVIGSFAAILKQGQESGVFRDVHPILAYSRSSARSSSTPRANASPRNRRARRQDFPHARRHLPRDRHRARPGDRAKDAPHEENTMRRTELDSCRLVALFAVGLQPKSRRAIACAFRATSKRPRPGSRRKPAAAFSR